MIRIDDITEIKKEILEIQGIILFIIYALPW
jgi:hypothetical protein